jgi:hypothetical protein
MIEISEWSAAPDSLETPKKSDSPFKYKRLDVSHIIDNDIDNPQTVSFLKLFDFDKNTE